MRHSEPSCGVARVKDIISVVPDTVGSDISSHGSGDGVSGAGECRVTVDGGSDTVVRGMDRQERLKGTERVGMDDGVELARGKTRVVVFHELLHLVGGGGVWGKIGAFVGIVPDEEWHAYEPALFEKRIQLVRD